MTTADLERLIGAAFARTGAEPLLPGHRTGDGAAFPACVSICVNEEVVHGVPGPRILRGGDIITIDTAARLAGWCADAARSMVVGAPAGEADRGLPQAALACLDAGLSAMQPRVAWSDVARAVADAAARQGVVLATGYAGHGIGCDLHEAPEAWLGTGPDGSTGQDFVLRPGMVLTLEPIVMEGRGTGNGVGPELLVLDDGWTVLARDRRWACHEERTVAITRGGPEVLTVSPTTH
jgi:methionyl aminopeptidase